MNQTQLYQAIADEAKLSAKQVKEVFAKYEDLVTVSLRNGVEMPLPGLGVFRKTDRPERQGRNPGTGAAITIKASSKVAFTVKKALKEAVLG